MVAFQSKDQNTFSGIYREEGNSYHPQVVLRYPLAHYACLYTQAYRCTWTYTGTHAKTCNQWMKIKIIW